MNEQEVASESRTKLYIEALYQTYGKTSDDEIRGLLERVLVVAPTHKGEGSVYGYYTMDAKTMAKIRKSPRATCHTWEHKPNKLVKGLREFKRIPLYAG